MTITARQAGLYDQIPARHRMGLLRALWIIVISSLRNGGISFVAKRVRNLLNMLKH